MFASAEKMAETTKKLYESHLKRLNDGKLPTSPSFLKDTQKIETFLEKYSPNTKKSYYICIVSYLKGKKVSKKTLEFYTKKMLDSNKKFNETSDEKTEKQKTNWMNWNDIVELHKNFQLPDKITNETDYLTVLKYVALSLYVLTPPRRIRD